VLQEHSAIEAKGENIIRHRLSQITGVPFFNLSKFTIAKPAEKSGLNGLLDDPNQLVPNLNSYINGFSPNVRAIIERFKFPEQIAYMAEKDLLYLVIKQFAAIDLSPVTFCAGPRADVRIAEGNCTTDSRCAAAVSEARARE